MEIDLVLIAANGSEEDHNGVLVIAMPRTGESLHHPDGSHRIYKVVDVHHQTGPSAKSRVIAEEITAKPKAQIGTRKYTGV